MPNFGLVKEVTTWGPKNTVTSKGHNLHFYFGAGKKTVKTHLFIRPFLWGPIYNDHHWVFFKELRVVTAATYLHFLMPSWATFALAVVCQRWKKPGLEVKFHHFVWGWKERVVHHFL